MKYMIAALLLAASAMPSAACTQYPAAAPIENPRTVAGARHARTEAYIQNRLAERPFATIGIGDSIMGMWPVPLLEGKWGGPTLNAGRGGATTLHWLDWLDRWDWSLQNPAVVHINIARNDITYGYCPVYVARSTLAVIAKVKAKWPSARVVWQTMIPGGQYLRLKAYEIREINRLVVEQAPVVGFEVLDAYSVVQSWCAGARVCGVFLAGDAYRGGPVHLGENGYEMIYRDAPVLP